MKVLWITSPSYANPCLTTLSIQKFMREGGVVGHPV